MKYMTWLQMALMATGLVAAAETSESRFFPEKGTHFGVYYYPEHWPEDQWERDIKRVGELGFDFIHYGEFAWARLEPADGTFDFAWMDKAVDLAAQNGLKVIMSTPSPCPPAWLASAHPEILTVNSNGQRTHHRGSRLTGSLANPVYREWHFLKPRSRGFWPGDHRCGSVRNIGGGASAASGCIWVFV